MPNPPTRNESPWSTRRLRGWAGPSLMVALATGNAAVVRGDDAAVTAKPPVAGLATAPSQAEVIDLRQTVAYLASDELEGRGTGTPAQAKAAEFIAGTFAKLKLEPPPGWGGYFQPFKVTSKVMIDPATTLAAGEGANWLEPLGKPALAAEKDYVPLPMSGEGDATAGVVFAGYGVSDAHRGYDEYAGVDVKGKIVLVLRYEPVDAEGKSAFTGKKDDWSENATFARKLALAAQKGAAALLVVNPPNFRTDDKLFDFAFASSEGGGGLLSAQVTKPVADALLKAGGLPATAEVQKAIDEGKVPASKPLPGVTARLRVALKKEQRETRNVAAVLPGTGPRASEFVVVGAHYDHLGRGGPGAFPIYAGKVHHGADDNASGTTAVLKLAELFAAAGPQDRSILFVGFTGEEWGLLGSKQFVNHPPVPLDKVAAMLNLDMVGRVKDNKLEVGGTGTAPSLQGVVAAANAGGPLKLNTGSKGGLGPSDHMSFGLKKVPVLFFFSGLHADYHRPTDTADKINYAGMGDVVALAQKTVVGLTKMGREQYVAKYDGTGLFGAMTMGATQPTGSPSGRARAALGVIPDYGADDSAAPGVRIAGATEGSAAAAAGLKEGDVLIGWNDKPLNNLNDLMAGLGGAKPGDKVKIKIRRDGKDVEMEATLTERKG
ncbi:MAG: ywaD [Phycisphaerales bacterium]|nr:ywaD [Phycisphaerales bacterium]